MSIGNDRRIRVALFSEEDVLKNIAIFIGKNTVVFL